MATAPPPPPAVDDDDNNNKQETFSVTKSAAQGTIATILLRLVSFVCTQWTFRKLDPTVLGQTSIQLELLLTTVLFVSREGFRMALTRNISEHNWNVAWLSLPVVTVISGAALLWHVLSVGAAANEDNASSRTDFWYGGILYCVASCIEGWGEPAVLYALRRMNVALKASVEGAATVTKTFSTVLLLQALPQRPITAFGIAQVIYACTYTGILYARTFRNLPWPARWSTRSLDSQTCSLTLLFTLQGLFKHFLTEGDRFLLTWLSADYEQGVYAMGSAYGGLAARLLLQPLEENARLLWSRLAGGGRRSTTTSTNTSRQQQSAKSLQDSYTVLVKVVLYLGLIFGCMAVNYTGILLNVLAGRKWGSNAEAAAVLAGFCVYTAFLACNGMTEAFVYGVASTAQDMGQIGLVHTVVGLVFAVTAALAVGRYGTLGLVAANCLAMGLRSIYSVCYAANYFHKEQQHDPKAPLSFGRILQRLVWQMLPHPVVLVAFGSSFAATRRSLMFFHEQVDGIPSGTMVWWKAVSSHVGVGAACAIGTLSLAYVLETSFRKRATSLYKGKLD